MSIAAVTIQDTIERLKEDFSQSLISVQSVDDLEKLQVRFLGRKGCIANHFKTLGTLVPEDRKRAGKLLNDLKTNVQAEIDAKLTITGPAVEASAQTLDTTLPGKTWPIGRYHPLTTVLRSIKSTFQRMGFSVVEGLEVETEYYNFEALNIPKGHPARDMHDTLFVGNEVVLRTHTSPVQIRVMESQPPPVRIISPGRCYRRDTPDATHSPVFHQVEGLCVDEGVTFADLKGVILTFAQQLIGSDVKIRFRPSFFPFTEPSAEYDFSCLMCKGRGCRICKGTGWIEISGAGMVNPAVYEYVGYDAEKYTGYAFGMGVERIAMLMYEVNDIRLFYENDVRFLHQF